VTGQRNSQKKGGLRKRGEAGKSRFLLKVEKETRSSEENGNAYFRLKRVDQEEEGERQQWIARRGRMVKFFIREHQMLKEGRGGEYMIGL